MHHGRCYQSTRQAGTGAAHTDTSRWRGVGKDSSSGRTETDAAKHCYQTRFKKNTHTDRTVYPTLHEHRKHTLTHSHTHPTHPTVKHTPPPAVASLPPKQLSLEGRHRLRVQLSVSQQRSQGCGPPGTNALHGYSDGADLTGQGHMATKDGVPAQMSRTKIGHHSRHDFSPCLIPHRSTGYP